MHKRVFIVLTVLISHFHYAQNHLVPIEQWQIRIQKAEPFPPIDDNILKYAALGVDELNWFSLRETQAVRYGLTVNDSVDERRHPYLASTAFQRMQNQLDCKLEVEDIALPLAYLDLLREKRDDGHWVPLKIAGPVSINELAKHSNAAAISWKRANLHLLHLHLPSKKTYLFVPSYERNGIDSIIAIILKNQKQEQPQTQSQVNLYEITVKGGESLSVIAMREGVRINDIIRWNKLSGDRIYAGQKLIIFGEKPVKKQDTKNTEPIDKQDVLRHTVKSGESLWSIAQQYNGISAEDIQYYNNLQDTRIDIGQVLLIPKANVNE